MIQGPAEFSMAERRHQLLAEHANDVIWTMDLDGVISYISPAIEQVRGLTAAEAMAQSLPEIHPPESMARSLAYFSMLVNEVACGRVPPPFHGELEYYRKDGSTVWCEVRCFPNVDPDGRVVELLGVSRDISERRRYEQWLQDARAELEAANAELARLATTDPLTGVGNRRHFDTLAGRAIALAARHESSISLLMIDVDHFKRINDTAGHLVGDQVLVELAARLTSRLRATDLLARWGGEEFVVLLPHTDLDDAAELADGLRRLVMDEPVAEVSVTVSIGVTEFVPGDTLDDLLARVDQALYRAKDVRNAVELQR